MDDLLAYLARFVPVCRCTAFQAEQRLARKAQEEAVRYLDVLTPEAQAAREKLARPERFLAGYPKLTDRLSTAAKAKRVNEHTNPAHKWVALAIVLAGLIAAVYSVIAWRRQGELRYVLHPAGPGGGVPVLRYAGHSHHEEQQAGGLPLGSRPRRTWPECCRSISLCLHGMPIPLCWTG